MQGHASWTIKQIIRSNEIIFDVQNLNITKVTLDNDTSGVFFALGDKDKFLGQALSIPIQSATKKVNIYYSTAKDAAALQWLNPQQTAGKKLPFLFTQSQAILAGFRVRMAPAFGLRIMQTSRSLQNF